MFEQTIARAQRLLLSPKSEWDAIAAEPVNTQETFKSYVMPLAAVPVIASFIGLTVVGVSFFGNTVRLSFFDGLVNAAVSYALALGGVYIFAWIINWLAPNFGAQPNFDQAFKVSAFVPTASWIAGAALILPSLGLIALLGGLYSLYLLFVGLPRVMKPAADQATVYTIVSLVVAVVTFFVINIVASGLVPGPNLPSG